MSEIKVGDYVRTFSCTGIVVKIEKGLKLLHIKRDDKESGGGIILPNGYQAWIDNLHGAEKLKIPWKQRLK